jgi:tRNA C32,U32 (ribose-2'-O)-methylase TrmJ
MAGGVESLNVASAAAVVCFEWARRRGERTPDARRGDQPKRSKSRPVDAGRRSRPR